MTLVSYAIALLLLSLIVFVHELGHFVIARLFGITVEVFSLGFGPEILGFTLGNTRYRLSWIPFGGYCKLKGEMEHTTPDSLYGKPPWVRILVLFAGAGFNILFALVMMTALYRIGYREVTPGRIVDVLAKLENQPSPAWESGLRPGDEILAMSDHVITSYQDIMAIVSLNANQPLTVRYSRQGRILSTTVTPHLVQASGVGDIGILPVYEVVVGGVLSNSPADHAHLERGDRIIAVNGMPVRYYYEFRQAIKDFADQQVSLTIVRREMTNTLSVTLSQADGQGFLGIVLAGKIAFAHTNTIQSPHLLSALVKGSGELWKQLLLTIQGVSRMVQGNLGVSQNLYGPIRIVRDTAMVTQWMDFALLVRFMALISLALGITNLLPIPGLDGGHILINTIEWVSHKKMPDALRIAIENIGVLFLLVLAAWVLSNDITNLFQGR